MCSSCFNLITLEVWKSGNVEIRKCVGHEQGQVLGLIFARYVLLDFESRYPIIVYSVANYRPHLSHFWANIKFSGSQLSHYLFLWIDPFFRLNEEHFTFNLQYKHSGRFANRKYEKLSYPKKLKNVRPHSSNSIENTTPSSGTSPFACYKEVPPPPRAGITKTHFQIY